MPKSCCQPCPDVETVNVPGDEGPGGNDGTDGTNGIDAFTFTTADFIVPAIGDQVTVAVGNNSWMVIGQPIFIEGAGIFTVVSLPSTTSVVLEYADYSINVNEAATIVSGSGVSPSGSEPDVTLLPSISEYAVGGSQALTTTPAQLLGLGITLPSAKSYLLMATVRFDFVAATFEANRIVTAKLRRTNNTAGDIANAVQASETDITLLETSTFMVVALPPVVYTASAGDTIELFGSFDTSPYSGALQTISGSMLAIPLF